MMLFVTLAMLIVLVCLQVWSLVALGPRAPVGDEGEYLSSSRGVPERRPFLRVPMMEMLVSLLGASENDQGRVRSVMAVAGLISVVLVALAAWALGGWPAVLAALIFLALLPERLILNNHLWPDPLIAVWLAAINLFLVWPINPDIAAAGLGILVGLSALTRIEQVVLVVAVPWAFSFNNDMTALHVLLICAPCVLFLAFCTARNYRRFGIALPDNTWLFNLRVAEAEMDAANGITRIEPLVQRVGPSWHAVSPQQRSRSGLKLWWRLARRPWRYARTVASRSWSLLGSDSFVSECLLPASGQAYPNMSATSANHWRIILRLSFPLLMAALLTLCFVTQKGLPAFVIPTIAIYAVAAAFHSRTRFRITLFPGLALLFAYMLPHSISELAQPSTVLYAVLALGIAVLLICFPTRRELS